MNRVLIHTCQLLVSHASTRLLGRFFVVCNDRYNFLWLICLVIGPMWLHSALVWVESWRHLLVLDVASVVGCDGFLLAIIQNLILQLLIVRSRRFNWAMLSKIGWRLSWILNYLCVCFLNCAITFVCRSCTIVVGFFLSLSSAYHSWGRENFLKPSLRTK